MSRRERVSGTPEPAEMVRRNDGLAHWSVRRFLRLTPASDAYEDAVQEARLSLIHSARGFDPARGFRFATYAVKGMRNAMSNMARRHARRPESVSLDHPSEDGDSSLASTVPAPAVAAAPEDAARLWERVAAAVSVRELMVLRYRFTEGLTLRQTGERLGICGELVRQVEGAALARLREVLTDA